jgi:hypothetical protein
LLTRLRTDIEEWETLEAGKKGMKKAHQFLADAMQGHCGKKFPITARAIMNNAWT